MKSGATTTIPQPVPSTPTCFACDKSWRKILETRYTSARFTERDTSLSADRDTEEAGKMGSVRLRTKFLISMLLTSAGLTAVSLLIVQRTVENQVRRNLADDL